MEQKPLKIAITGPESTGKSSLTRELAHHFNSPYITEFAREYIDNLDREYNHNDILVIAQHQYAMELAAKKQGGAFLFCDTELIVTRIWSMHKYGKSHPWIDDKITENRYDLYLLCNIDLPWEYDKQREHPHLREYFFNWYRSELENYAFPYAVVSGTGKERIANAISIINEYFNLTK